jgi:hypothetical protein
MISDRISLMALLGLVLVVRPASAQSPADIDLPRELTVMDSLLFERGFNNCDLAVMEQLLADDIEMYHDIAGPMQSKHSFLDAVRNNICSRQGNKPVRKLVPGTLVHFPLFEQGVLYGGIQQGRHEFYVQEPSGRMILSSKARFTHLWLLEDGAWKLTRVYSFDHQLATDR